MKQLSLWSMVTVLTSGIFFARQGNAGSRPPLPEQVVKQSYCRAPEYHQFDFWIGDWDAFQIGSATPVARVQVDRTLDGCVLREDYQDKAGHKGQSFSIYDEARNVWHQSWVTNRGQLLVIEGSFRDGQMVLSGVDGAKPGRTVVRGIWKPVDGGVREMAVTSTDGGMTWKPWFDLMFRPHKR